MKSKYLIGSVFVSAVTGALIYGAYKMTERRESHDRSTKTVIERSNGRIEIVIDDIGPRITITDKKGKIVDITVDGLLLSDKEGKKVCP